MKQNSQIKGITISNLTRSFAWIVHGWHFFPPRCLDTFELFGEYSGLKVNIEKTSAVWLGSKQFSKDFTSGEKFSMDFFYEPFNILGITFFVETQRIAEHNCSIKLVEVRKLLD